VVAASFGLVIALPIETGMLLAIVLSFLHSLYIVARPYCVELAKVPGSTVWWTPSGSEKGEHMPEVLVFAPGAPLNFTNAAHICDKIKSAIGARRQPVKLLIIEASGIIDIDYRGSHILQRAVAELRAKDISVSLARLLDVRAQIQARRTGLIEAIGAEHVFMSVDEAVQSFARGRRD
jgi:sulfate permease, SulP family